MKFQALISLRDDKKHSLAKRNTISLVRKLSWHVDAWRNFTKLHAYSVYSVLQENTPNAKECSSPNNDFHLALGRSSQSYGILQ